MFEKMKNTVNRKSARRPKMDSKTLRCKQIVVVLSLLLLMMTIPHVLEDFAVGEPAKNGVPELLLRGVVAGLMVVQTLGLYFIGGNHRVGYLIQIAVGIIWPLLAGFAQMPAILSGRPYRAGSSSIFFVIGIIVIGVLLVLASLRAVRLTSNHKI